MKVDRVLKAYFEFLDFKSFQIDAEADLKDGILAEYKIIKRFITTYLKTTMRNKSCV
jgi:hypothetical protein